MTLKKFGTGDGRVLNEEKIEKEAQKEWTEKDTQELREENTKD